MTELVLRTDLDGVATLTLNRPDVHNALRAESFVVLRGHIDKIATQVDDIGCVVLQGAGRSFCAGADLKAFKARQASDPDPTPFNRATLIALGALPQPVIAAVAGYCLTGGLELALAADMIFAAESAKFADTHQRWGLHAGWGLTQRLPRRIGIPLAKELMLSGREVLATEARLIGLVNRVIPDAQLASEVQAFAATIAAHPRSVTRWVKRMIDGGIEPCFRGAQQSGAQCRSRNASPYWRLLSLIPGVTLSMVRST
jgi:enoyl-CoA hydratase